MRTTRSIELLSARTTASSFSRGIQALSSAEEQLTSSKTEITEIDARGLIEDWNDKNKASMQDMSSGLLSLRGGLAVLKELRLGNRRHPGSY